MKQIILIVHDIRSTHNVGALLRTAECLGINKLYFTGYTPYPSVRNDARLPHIHQKLTQQIHKTALGTENLVVWQHADNVYDVIDSLKEDGYRIVGLEQSAKSHPLPSYHGQQKTALIIGREVEGIEPAILNCCDDIVEIPQFGQKKSLNVVQATAIALYHLQST